MIGQNFENFFETQFLEYINNITNQPINVVTTVIDIKLLKCLKKLEHGNY